MSNRDPSNQMWAQALALLDQADQMHRQFFVLRPSARAALHPVWEPPIDVLETDDEVHVIVALPGVPAEQVSVTHTGGELAISAMRVWPGQQVDARIRRLEIPHGRFERRIATPPDWQLRQSRLVNGCLYVTVNKKL